VTDALRISRQDGDFVLESRLRLERPRSEAAEGTLVEDRVRYRPWGGWLADAMPVRRELEGIFRFRQERLRERLGSGDSRAATGAV